MRKLTLAALVIASLTGVAYAQVERSDALSQQIRLANLVNDIVAAKTTCVDASGAARKLYETTMRDSMEYKCVPFAEELMYGHLRKKP